MANTVSWFRLLLSILIFFIVVGISVYCYSELMNTLLLIDIRWVCVGLICYGVSYILRALRLHIISNFRINFWPNSVYSTSLHGFIAYLIPMQLGDVSLPMILKSTNGIELAEGSALLIRTRFLDMMSLGMVMIAAAMFSKLSLSPIFRWIWLVSGSVLFLFPFLIQSLILRKHFYLRKFSRFFKFFAHAGKFRIAESLISFAIWISIACVLFSVIQAVNLKLGFGGALLLISLQLPLQVLPVQGFANTGNHEGGWVVALSLLSIPLKQAAEFAVVSHIIILFYVAVLGICPLATHPTYYFGKWRFPLEKIFKKNKAE